MLLLIATAFAGDAVPPLVEANPRDPLPGVALTWNADACALKLRITNTGTAPVVVDWLQSTISDPGLGAVGLVPGTSSKYSAMINIPPTVAPVGGYADVWLFRKDRLPTDVENACVYSTPGAANISLHVNDGWVTQMLQFKPDPAGTKIETCSSYRSGRNTAHAFAWLSLGVGTTGGVYGIVKGASMIDGGKADDAPATIAAGAVMAAGGALAFGLLEHRAATLSREATPWNCGW